MNKDYYNVLGVDKNASQDEIKKAFRQKAHQCHPDKAGGDEAKFKELNEAYQVLGNQQKREQYDRFGSSFQNGGGQGSGFGGFGSGGVHFDMGGFEDMFGDFGDIFGFGSGSRDSGRKNKQGGDIKMAVTIDFKEAVFGVDKEISFKRKNTCSKCGGNGAEPGAKIEKCSQCQGSGYEIRMQRTIFGNIQMKSSCSRCGGEGNIASKECFDCHGKGVKNETNTITVKIPAGIDEGEFIRLRGQGEAGEKGGDPGDLYLQISVKSDKRFQREGYDIRSVAEIDFVLASLGGKIEIDTVGGQVDLNIPEGTQSGTVFKLREKGIPRLKGKGRGDHLVEIIVKIPTKLSRKQKEILKSFNG